MLAALAVLLIVGGAALAGLLALRVDSRVEVLVAARDIATGTRLTDADLTTTAVAAEGTNLIPASQRALVTARYARVPITAGQLVDTGVLTDSAPLQPGLVAVGASLAAGRMPASGLQPGDVVELVRVGDGLGEVMVPDAYVSSTGAVGANEIGGSSTLVTFIVKQPDGARIAGAAADGALAAVLVTRGEARS